MAESSVLRREAKSRRARQCDNCLMWIQLGERYARLTLPPHRDMNSSDHFWTVNVHLACVRG